jgi:hypothetical protein
MLLEVFKMRPFTMRVLPFFISLYLTLFASTVELLTDLESHTTFLREAIQKATGDTPIEVIIVSPYIRESAITHDMLEPLLFKANHHLHVYGCENDPQQSGREILYRCFVDYKLMRNIHTKCIIIGNEALAIGSFNWLSSVRYEPYILKEATTVIKGVGVGAHIQSMREHIASFSDSTEPKRYRELRAAIFPSGLPSAFNDDNKAIEIYNTYKDNTNLKPFFGYFFVKRLEGLFERKALLALKEKGKQTKFEGIFQELKQYGLLNEKNIRSIFGQLDDMNAYRVARRVKALYLVAKKDLTIELDEYVTDRLIGDVLEPKEDELQDLVKKMSKCKVSPTLKKVGKSIRESLNERSIILQNNEEESETDDSSET